MKVKRSVVIGVVTIVVGIFWAVQISADTGNWLVRLGAHTVAPKSDNHDVVEVDAATMLTFNVTYFATPHWAVELLAAAPFKHDIDLVGGSRVATAKQLPPTLSAQYHFNPEGKLRPYAGVGVNWTLFFQEDTTGALAGSRLSLDDSVGPAAQLGIDFDVGDRWFVNAEARFIRIETKAKLNGVSLGDVEIDPWAFGLNVGMRL